MKKNRVFFLIAIVFVFVMAFFAWHMFSITGKPWDKEKNNVIDKYQIK